MSSLQEYPPPPPTIYPTPTEAAAIRFLAAWRASLNGNPKAWLAESDKAEKALVEALRARGVNVEAALREARGEGRRP